MKKLLTAILTASVLLFCSAAVTGENTSENTCDVVLCYEGDAYSADYVFEVIGNGTITSVKASIKNCFYDWNYAESEARLYISLASAYPMPNTVSIASVTADSQVELRALSVTVNGSVTDDVYSHHSPETIPGQEPTSTEPGLTEGMRCSVCGIILAEQETIPVLSLLGDIDGDSFVDINDSLLLFQHSIFPDNYPISYLGNIDFNNDSYVDIEDALLLFMYSILPDLYPIE